VHVAMLIGRLAVGGAETQFVQIARGLANRGHRVTFYTIYPGGALARELDRCRNVELAPLLELKRGARLRGLLRALRLLRSRLRQDPPDVLYSALYVSNLLAGVATRGCGLKSVWGIRSANPDLGWKERLPMWMGTWMCGRISGLICNSFAGLALSRAWRYTTPNATVIWNGVASHRFRPEEGARRRFRKRYGLAAEDVGVGIVGRVTPEKCHDLFFRAAGRAAQRAAQLRFACIVPSLEDVTGTMRRRGAGLEDRLLWIDGGSGIPAIYPGLDVICSASSSEGFANVIGEGMAAGLPAVVTNVGDSALVVGDAGCVVPPGDADALAAAFVALSANPRRRAELGSRARRRAVSEFSIARCVSATERYLLNVAGLPGPTEAR